MSLQDSVRRFVESVFTKGNGQIDTNNQPTAVRQAIDTAVAQEKAKKSAS